MRGLIAIRALSNYNGGPNQFQLGLLLFSIGTTTPFANVFLLELLCRNVQRFRGGLVSKAHRLCLSLNSRRESNTEEERRKFNGVWTEWLHETRISLRPCLPLEPFPPEAGPSRTRPSQSAPTAAEREDYNLGFKKYVCLKMAQAKA